MEPPQNGGFSAICIFKSWNQDTSLIRTLCLVPKRCLSGGSSVQKWLKHLVDLCAWTLVFKKRCINLNCLLEVDKGEVGYIYVSMLGTGSGVGTKVLELLQDEYPEVYRFTTAVFPSAEDDVITSPYNRYHSHSSVCIPRFPFHIWKSQGFILSFFFFFFSWGRKLIIGEYFGRIVSNSWAFILMRGRKWTKPGAKKSSKGLQLHRCNRNFWIPRGGGGCEIGTRGGQCSPLNEALILVC